MNKSPHISSINQIIECIRDKKIAHLVTEDLSFTSNQITINSDRVTNFGSCSYLGLEFNEQLKKSARDCIDQFGTQFSASRAYISLGIYDQLEEKLLQIFDNPSLVVPTTTLGHMAAIPILIDKKDAIIMDHQVHNSVQTSVALVKERGVHVELVRHNHLDKLEQKIKALQNKYESIWYMADGVYSMFGDFAPVNELKTLLDKYPNFNVYIDDAHGMSCYGKHGRGYVLSQGDQHERMVVAVSFAKAFASGGGAIVFPSKEMAQKVRNCGGPLITSGPMQPAALGAALASANIHLSDEIISLQEDLQEKILYTHLLLKKMDLPDVSEKKSPIFFIGVGLPKIGYNIVSRMKQSGHFVNIGIFPAVPMKNTGIRFTITRLHTFEQIESMVRDLAHHYQEALKEENVSIDQVYKAFKLQTPEDNFAEKEVRSLMLSQNLTVELSNTIMDIKKEEWDRNLGDRGMFDWNNLNILENTFCNQDKIENNWSFYYLTVKDKGGEVILQTFLTSGLMKDDMLSDNVISEDVEKYRKEDPYFYTSNFLTVGCLITEGDHLYLNKSGELWREALGILFQQIEKLQRETEATTLMIRDMNSSDHEMDNLMVDNGFFKVDMLENFQLNTENWSVNDSFKETLSKRSKRHFKENVERFEEIYDVRVIQKPTEKQLLAYYQLYLNVFGNSYEINTFKLPFTFFENMRENKNWEVIALYLKKNQVEDQEMTTNYCVGVVFAYKGLKTYIPALVGIDYQLNRQYNVYRQSIYQLIKRSKMLGYDCVHFGFSAGIEKKKFGAKPFRSCAYMQVKDNYKFESLMTGTFGKEEPLGIDKA